MTEDSKKVAGSGRKPPRAGMGRPKGSANKTTTALKEAILLAAQEAGGGDLVAYLKTQATTNPTAFMSLLGKVLPLTLSGDAENPLTVVTKIEREIVRPKEGPKL